ncbi:unnamed protein product [Diatraea saccharalis]|uniref:Uncharacterized protein n=1 Tax=Diatraea saccharalis TaxID=40085 RepID=A0A9N9RE47_9NEOP|nr:unnamed protein product [Diatraea saccharalis]
MRESKPIYITKHNHKYQLYNSRVINTPRRYGCTTTEAGVQYEHPGDIVICTCKNGMGVRRHQEIRYLSSQPRHVYAYHGSRSFTDIGVGNLIPLQKKKIKRIYLPETDDRGVGSSDLSSFLTRKTKPYNRNYYYNNKNTSTRGVGGAVDDTIIVIHKKLSPIINTKSGTTSPKLSLVSNQRNNVEIGSNTQGKTLATTSTQIEKIMDNDDIKIEVKTVEVSIEHDREFTKQYKKFSQKNLSSVPVQLKEKPISKRAQEAERIFSSDSLVEHIHNLENPSEDKQSHVDVMENKLEREYRKMFSTKSKESKDQKVEEVRTESSMKSTSLLRRRFEALRRGLARKEDSKRSTNISDKGSSNGSELSKRDVSIASDPPSLQSRSYTDVKIREPFTKMEQYVTSNSKPIHGKPLAIKTNSYRSEEDDSSYQGATGMFKLWGKKFNFDDEENAQSQFKEQNIIINENDNKKEGKRFFFFKKKSKDKPTNIYKQKKGLTAGRCEVGDGLIIKIGAAYPKPHSLDKKECRKAIEKIPEEYEEMFTKAWLQNFLAQTIESRNSVKVRWNNNAYATSSSTIFEIMENVYKDTGIIFRSKSEITTKESSYYKSNPKQRVNFVKDVEAWMIPKLIPDKPVITSSIARDEKEHDRNKIHVRISDQKWIIDKSKAFAHKIEVVLHSRNIVKSYKNPSTEYLTIDIPKGFFSDSGTDSGVADHMSNEEVYKIVEYESPESRTRANAANFETGDHLKDIKVTVSLKDENFESKIIETVIKRRPIQRDVVIQNSKVSIPNRCNVIGVGIITQKDTRIRKPILKIQDEYTDDESYHSVRINHIKSRFAESYLQDYYRHMSLGIDFSWCLSDSQVQCCSDISHNTVNNQGDGTKSCPNIYDDYITSTVISSCGTSCCSPCGPMPCSDSWNNNCKTGLVAKFYNKIKPKLLRVDTYPDSQKRMTPKDSLEVFKKRKLYALSAKSKWGNPEEIPYSIPSIESKGAPDTLIDCPKARTTCWKATSKIPKTKICEKHVSFPDCETLNTSLIKQLATTPSGILIFKGSSKCVECEKKGSICTKHTKIDPNPACEIPPPRRPCLDDIPTRKASPCCPADMIMPQTSQMSISKSVGKPLHRDPSINSLKLSAKSCISDPGFQCPPPSCPPHPCPPSPCPPNPCNPPPPPCSPKAQKSSFKCCPPPKKCHPFPTPLVPKSQQCPPKSSEPRTYYQPPKTCDSPRTRSKPGSSSSTICEETNKQKCHSPDNVPCGSPSVSGIHLSSPPRSRCPSPPEPSSCTNPSCPNSVSSPPEPRRRHKSPRSYESTPHKRSKPGNSSSTICNKPNKQKCYSPGKLPCGSPPVSGIHLSSPPRSRCPSPPTSCTNPDCPNNVLSSTSCDSSPISSKACPDNSYQRPQSPPCKKKPARSNKPNTPPCKTQPPKCSPKQSCVKPPKKSRKIMDCEPQKAKCPVEQPKPTRRQKKPECQAPKKPPCEACTKGRSGEFPWPLKNQNSYQSSMENVLSNCSSTEPNTKNKCTFETPVQCPSKQSCKSPPKISGIFLKLRPARKSSSECEAHMYNTDVRRPAISQLDDDIIINIKKCTDSTEEIREGLNIKVQDFDGNTLYERLDYSNEIENTNKQKLPSVLNEMYKNSNVHVVSTSRPVQNMQCHEESNLNLADTKSEASVANLIEINFKLKVTQGDKTTELNIGTDDASNDLKNCPKNYLGQTSQNVFISKDETDQCKDEYNDKNDVNIKIIIKNYKPKKRNKSMGDEFVQSIAQKFQTVSTGYSDILAKTNEDNVYSIHKTSLNLTSSNDGSQIDIQAKEKIIKEAHTDIKQISHKVLNKLEDSESKVTNENSVSSIHRTIQKHTYSNDQSQIDRHPKDVIVKEENIQEIPVGIIKRANSILDKLEHSKSKLDINQNEKVLCKQCKENEIDDIQNYIYKEENTYIAKKDRFSLKDTQDSHANDILANDSYKPMPKSNSNIVPKSLTKEEKKSILKKILEKVKRTNKKEKMKEFTEVLNMILNDNSDHEETTQECMDLMKKMRLVSPNSNQFRDTDSLNNYFTRFDSSVLSEQESHNNANVKYPSENVSETSVRDTDESYDENETPRSCICSTFAERLNMCSVNGNGCCCRYPTKADVETCCDLRTEEDFLLLNYKTIEYIDVETQNSKYFCNGNKISVHSKAVSDSFKNKNDAIVDTFEKSESIKNCKNGIPTHVNHMQTCHYKKFNRNSILGISDEDKVLLLNTQSTNVAVDTMFSRNIGNDDEEKEKLLKKAYAKYERNTDILQSYETKKAVLQIYAEKTSDEGRLVAKLPKFVQDKENDIEKNYEKYVQSMYNGIKNKFVMMSVEK